MEAYLHINSCRATSFEHLFMVRLPFFQDGIESALVLVLKKMVVAAWDRTEYCIVCHQTECEDSKTTMPRDNNLRDCRHPNQVRA
jgi:hypothetical protein